jgi:hypothetical protein
VSDSIDANNPDDAAGGLFDLRYLIGALFTFYGLLLVVASFFVKHAKSGDIDINLWLGIGMLLLGLFFLIWARLRPLRLEGPSALAKAEGAGPER